MDLEHGRERRADLDHGFGAQKGEEDRRRRRAHDFHRRRAHDLQRLGNSHLKRREHGFVEEEGT